MSWPIIDPNVPLGTEKIKFGDDRIREAKQHLVDGLQAISNYSKGGSVPALKTAVWTTATRPSGANLVDKVTGLNTTHGCVEYYDLSTTTWKYYSGQGYWNVSGRPSSPPVGVNGYNTDLSVIERWSGSAWVRISGGRRGDVKIWSGWKTDIEAGWCLCDGVIRNHPEGGTFTPPNFRDRFLVSIGAKYDEDDTGGEAEHILRVDEMPSHNHLILNVGQFHQGGQNRGGYWSGDNTNMYTEISGENKPHNNLPPYYAVCYLFKL